MSSGRQGINTAGAPAPQPFYNQAIVANGLVFCSGQVPKDLSGKFVEGPIQARAVSPHERTPHRYLRPPAWRET